MSSIVTSHLFKIGDVDMTTHIVLGTYKVNNNLVYETYTDANYVTHHTIKRKKMSGTFTMLFKTIDEYETFVNLLSTKMNSEGGYSVSAWSNNELKNVTCNMFIGYTPTNDLPTLAKGNFAAYEITVEQP